MRVFTFKASRKMVFSALVAFTAVVAAIILIIGANTTKEVAAKIENVNAANHEERMTFLTQFGWVVNKEPAEVKEVIIPQEFDETFTAYNEIQKNQGFDLIDYQGKRAKRWTYTVENYPGYEDRDCILVNILIVDGKVIGGDVCSTELDGFMHGFKA